MSARQPRMMIFLPLSRQDARAIRTDGSVEETLEAYAATGEMVAAHGYPPTEREDADYAAMIYASIAGLTRSEDYARLVVAAEVPIAHVKDGRADAQYGAIRVDGLDWSDVTAVFVDEAEAASAVQAARQAIVDSGEESDRALAKVLELAEVITLSDDHDLLWHHPDEDW